LPASPSARRVLADFIEAARTSHSLTRAPVTIGYSNGAIIAAAAFLTRRNLLAGVILRRPLSPFTNYLPDRPDGTPLLVIDSGKASRRSPGNGLRLAECLTLSDATVTHHVLPVGHPIMGSDRQIA